MPPVHESRLRVRYAETDQMGVVYYANHYVWMEVGRVDLFDLGPSSQGWMRYPRFPIRTLQKVFVTAAVLPCVILGIFALLWTRNLRPLIILLLVPVYYVIFQSALHTERRYVIVIHYFTLIFAAIFLSGVFRLVKHGLISLSPARQTSS